MRLSSWNNILAAILLIQAGSQQVAAATNYGHRLWQPARPEVASRMANAGLRARWLRPPIGLRHQNATTAKRSPVAADGGQVSPPAYLVSPLTGQVLEVGHLERFSGGDNQLGADYQLDQASGNPGIESSRADCNTVRAPMELWKEELEPGSGRLLRTCRAILQVNRCEGACHSSAEPSVRLLPGGLRRECACCSEGGFRRRQVRLGECRRPSAEAEAATDELEYAQGFMLATLEEPTDCRCRRCDSFI